LDGLRAIAILMVFSAHANFLSLAVPLDKVAYNALLAGWSGVDLFFVLSGYLITGILFEAKASPRYYRSFYARRFLRIFPLYYAFLALYFGLLAAAGFHAAVAAAPEQLWYWTYLSNLRVALAGQDLPPHVGVFWSLAVEEHFYLLWPVLVRALSRRALIRLCLVLVAGCLMLRTWMVGAGFGPIAVYVLSPTRVDALAFGALVALLCRGEIQPKTLRRGGWLAIACGGATLIAVSAVVHQLYYDKPLVATLGLTALALTYAGVLTLTVTATDGSRLRHLLANPWLGRVGRYSYGMYVLHTLIIDLCRAHLFTVEAVPSLGGSRLPGQALFSATALALTFGAAWLSWRLLERRFLALKRHVPM
jgi:peptidoglycan/LPS O-acetylase OafA/YrhL